MTRQAINQAEWENAANWHGGIFGVYSSPRDSRVWVPKRSPWMGWTLNFAHPQSKWWLVGLVAGPLVLTDILRRLAR